MSAETLNVVLSLILFYAFTHAAIRMTAKRNPLELIIHALILVAAGIKLLAGARRVGLGPALAYFDATLASTRAGFLSFT